jgi:predicted nucleotidyltransferase
LSFLDESGIINRRYKDLVFHNDKEQVEVGHMDVTPILRQFKAGATTLYGERLKNIILFGSWARGEAGPESDIDLLVVLQGNIIPGREIDRMLDLITDLNLEHTVLLAVVPMSESEYIKVNSPLLLNIRQEGVAI